MGGGGNEGNLLNPTNLIPAVLTGGLSYAASSYKRSMTPPSLPNQPPPPDPGPIMHTFDDTADTKAQRQKKLAALQFGFASTITKKASDNAMASLATPQASALKTKTGQ